MFEKCLTEAEAILSSQNEPLVPVSVVWDEVVRRGKAKGFEVVSLSDFTALLEGDQRFQILPGKKDDDDGLVDEENLDDPEMGQMGFFPEDRVRLRVAGGEEIGDPSEEEEEISSMHVRGLVGRTKKTTPAIRKKEVKHAAKKKIGSKKKISVRKSKPTKKKLTTKRPAAKKRKK